MSDENPAVTPRRVPDPTVGVSIELALPRMPGFLQACFGTMFHLLCGVRMVRDMAKLGWEHDADGRGPGSITVFVGDGYALMDWYKLKFAEGLPHLVQMRQGPLTIPGLPKPISVCAAAACWDLFQKSLRVLGETPQGIVARRIVDILPEDGRFDRTVFIHVVYSLQQHEPLDIKFPQHDGLAEELAEILRSEEAKLSERLAREQFGPLPIEHLWDELEWEFGKAAAHDSAGNSETLPCKEKEFASRMPDNPDVEKPKEKGQQLESAVTTISRPIAASEDQKKHYCDPDNYWRNVWLYQLRVDGKTNSEILQQLSVNQKGYYTLESENALRSAIDNIAMHHGWPIRKGRPGRPRVERIGETPQSISETPQ